MIRESIYYGDAFEIIKSIPDSSIQLTVTSPPYFRQKDYGFSGQFGWESTPEEYTSKLGEIIQQLLRVTTNTGACFLVLGDSYVDRRLALIPQRVAIAATEAGWSVRNSIIWSKTDPPPESVRNRWRSSHENILFLTKKRSGYLFNVDAIRQQYSDVTLRRWGKKQVYGGTKSSNRLNPDDTRVRHGRTFALNPKGCVPTDIWQLPSSRSKEFHYATFPPALITPMILACSNAGDWLLDPFAGSGTTLEAGQQAMRKCIGIEMNLGYAKNVSERLRIPLQV